MGGRLVLVIGSECAALGRLGFTADRTAELENALVESGAWRPMLETGPVLDPDVTGLKAVITGAFAAADAARATLLVAFVGHGVTTAAEDFYLLARDSPAVPDSDTGFHLAQGIRERLNRHPSIDGFVMLVDACEAGEGLKGAARRWEVLNGAGRVELLVASTDGSAFNGCFTATLVQAFAAGVPHAGESLRCADVQPALGDCLMQDSARLAFSTGRGTSADSDDGLWLVPNVARRDDAVRGLATAGLVDQLTRGIIVTDSLRENLGALVDAGNQRLRVVTGPAGCGKSTVMSLLIRPTLVDTLSVSARYVDAVAFVDKASTIQTVSDQLIVQLNNRLNGFREAAEQVVAGLADEDRSRVDFFELAVVRPLQLCRQPGRRVNLLIDGFDQPEEGSRALIADAIRTLTDPCRPGLDHVRLIVAARSGTSGDADLAALSHAYRVALRPPTAAEMSLALQTRLDSPDTGDLPRLIEHTEGGGWLIARLFCEIPDRHTIPLALETIVSARLDQAVDGEPDKESLLAVLSLLLAAGTGPILPIELVRRALPSLGSPRSDAQVRDVLVQLGALIIRGHPGVQSEHVGIAHAAFADALTRHPRLGIDRIRDAHRALGELSALNKLPDGDALGDYVAAARPRHLLLSGDSAGAVAAIEESMGLHAADNRDRWATFLPLFENQLGLDHSETFWARRKVATWRGYAGNASGALAAFEELLANQTRVLGPDHPDTLWTRSDVARWRGESGDAAGALAASEELLADQTRVLGPDHPDTLWTRNLMARWRGESGDAAGALAASEELLADRSRVLGPDHPDTLWTRNFVARWRGKTGDAAGALAASEELLTDRSRVLGPDHPDTLRTRSDVACWRGESGDAAGALAALEELLADQTRVLSPDHPDTLRTCNEIAYWRVRKHMN